MVKRDAPAAGAEQRLKDLGLALPPPPTPFGAYVEAVKIGKLLFLSGMLPVIDRKPQFIGHVGGELSTKKGEGPRSSPRSAPCLRSGRISAASTR